MSISVKSVTARLILNDEHCEAARAKLKASGMFRDQDAFAAYKNCPICGQAAEEDLMYGADLARVLDRKDIVFSFTYTRPRRGSEVGRALACMRKACPTCAKRILPGLSSEWMKDTEEYAWTKKHDIPF